MKIRSTRPIDARVAGTKLPTWAIRVIIAAWRMKVDLPAMFGPVSTTMGHSLASKWTSFDT